MDKDKCIKDFLIKNKNIREEDIVFKWTYKDPSDLLHIRLKNNTNNYADKDGNLLFTEWYDWNLYLPNIDLFLIKEQDKFNFGDRLGNLILKEWTYSSYMQDITDYRAIILIKNNKFYCLDSKGNSIFKEEYDYIKYYKEYDKFLVQKDGKYNFITINEEVLLPIWFDKLIRQTNKDKIIVQLKGKYNLISNDFNYISDQWFNEINETYYSEYFILKNDLGKFYFCSKNRDCDILIKDVEEHIDLTEKLKKIKINGEYNILTKEGLLLFKDFYKEVKPVSGSKTKFIVEDVNKKKNIIDINDKLLFSEWYDDIEVINPYYQVTKEGQKSLTDKNGDILIKNCLYEVFSKRGDNILILKNNDKDETLYNRETEKYLDGWYKEITFYDSEGYIKLFEGDKFKIINYNFDILVDDFIDVLVYIEKLNLYKIKKDGKFTLLNEDFSFVKPNEWFYYIDYNPITKEINYFK